MQVGQSKVYAEGIGPHQHALPVTCKIMLRLLTAERLGCRIGMQSSLQQRTPALAE